MMQFDEMGLKTGKVLFLLPGTGCDYQTNFASVLSRLGEKYHLVCVNYDGFDGSGSVFPDMLTVTEKIEQYIRENYGGRIDGAIGSSLGSSFVGQMIQRQNVHLDHGIFGSPDLDQSGRVSAWLQSKLVAPLLTSFTKSEKKRAKTREKLKDFFEMDDEAADKFMACFVKFSPESIKNEYYTDLLTHLQDDIHVEHTKVHFIYANKMGEKYHDLETRAKTLDPDELQAARLSLRPEEEQRDVSRIEYTYGNSYDYDTMREAKNKVAGLLGEERTGTAPISLREDLRQKQKIAQERELPKRKKPKDLER